MTRKTEKQFLVDLWLYSEQNMRRFKNGWTVTELRNWFELDIYKKDFYDSPEKYNQFINRINKYQ